MRRCHRWPTYESLFRLLQGAADRSAVDFFSFTPGTPAPNVTGSYSTIASQVTVSGGYFAIDEFLFLLETLPRAAKVHHARRDAGRRRR